MNGWRLTGVLSLLLIAVSLFAFTGEASTVDGIRLVIRITARTSLALFLLAFTASALVQLVPSRTTRWIRSNRRYLGVSFAVSHFIHLFAIVALVNLAPDVFWQPSAIVNIVFGGLAYVFIASMAVTSFDRTAAWLGAQRWRLLHTAGIWYVWIVFAISLGKRAPADAFYWPLLAILIGAAVLRFITWQRARYSPRHA